VVVTDDGPGIPPEDAAEVFTRLYTVRATPGRAVGTGLGLAIVQELATAMGGTATAETPAGGGARITVLLPAPRAHSAPA
jgi:two-component system sensor histidine kinase KdpD